MDHDSKERLSEIARASAILPPETPSRAAMELTRRGRAAGDSRRLAEFLRIERGREA